MSGVDTEADLVHQARTGRTAAYAILARRWSARVMAVCHARVGCPHVAEDLTQETLLRAFRALPTLREPHKFGAWVRGIAVRPCQDWLKAKQRTQVPFSSLTRDGTPAEQIAGTADLAGDVETREERAQLLAAVDALPPACREVVMLYYYGDVTYRELAELLGVSAATINARLTRARALLRERLTRSET